MRNDESIARPFRGLAPMREAAPARRGELAVALQDAFTVAVRLRARRQLPTSAGAFRVHVKRLLATADDRARSARYAPEHVRLAVYAYVAFLDESVLNSASSLVEEWGRQPLQEEVFGDNIAGENFFHNLSELMARLDSEDLADALEVYLLSLLLGFKGKYAGNAAALHGTISAVQDRIRRIRGPTPLSPSWALPEQEVLGPVRDPWLPRLGWTAAAALALAASLYVLFRVALGARTAQLTALLSQFPQ